MISTCKNTKSQTKKFKKTQARCIKRWHHISCFKRVNKSIMGAYKHLTIVNLAQAKELSLRQQGLSLKRKTFA